MKFIVENISSKDVICSELKMSTYKELIKSIYGEEPDKQNVYLTIKDVFLNHTNLKEEEFDEISFFEVFEILAQLRSYSLGNKFSIIVYKNQKKVTVEIDLNDFKEQIKTIQTKAIEFEIEKENIKLVSKAPSLKKLLKANSSSHLLFVDSVHIRKDNAVQTFKITSCEMAEKVFQSLPIDVVLSFIKKLKETYSVLLKFNYLTKFSVFDYYLNLLPDFEHLTWVLKLIFNDSLQVIYDNLFYLSYYCYMNTEYLENCTPGEYVLFTKNLEQILSSKNNKNEQTENNLYNDIPPEQGDLNTEFSFVR